MDLKLGLIDEAVHGVVNLICRLVVAGDEIADVSGLDIWDG